LFVDSTNNVFKTNEIWFFSCTSTYVHYLKFNLKANVTGKKYNTVFSTYVHWKSKLYNFIFFSNKTV
jgi:hypothetical protein